MLVLDAQCLRFCCTTTNKCIDTETAPFTFKNEFKLNYEQDATRQMSNFGEGNASSLSVFVILQQTLHEMICDLKITCALRF